MTINRKIIKTYVSFIFVLNVQNGEYDINLIPKFNCHSLQRTEKYIISARIAPMLFFSNCETKMKGPKFMLNWPRGYKTFFMLNSTEHEIFPAHKC